MTSFVGGRPAADAMKPSEQSSERAKRDPETPAQSGIPGRPRPRPNSRSSVQFRASRASPARRCSVRSETEDHWPATRGPDGLATPRRTALERRRGARTPMESTPQTAPTTPHPRTGQGLSIQRRFTTAGVHPFDEVEWEKRTASVGSFTQEDVEFPASWSQNATHIVAQPYFREQLGNPAREHSVKQMIGRVAGTIARWGRERGYFATEQDGQAFEDELTYVLLHQMAAFNSPVWFNCGWHEEGDPRCQMSACFILSVEDKMESILAWNTTEGMIFRGGSGSGINLSKIRGSMEPLSKGGTASGPVLFMRGADAWAGSIKSRGGTHRASKMVVLDVDHPDIREFIWCKAKEEEKAAALRDADFDMSIDGTGFYSIQYQNANNSVRVTDEFMKSAEAGEEWHTRARVDGRVIDAYEARDLLGQI